MAKTGDGESLGTAEGALIGRAAHVLHADRPILDDTWAIRLLDPATQALIRDPGYAARPIEWGDFDVAPLFALNVGSLRYAEDEVVRRVRDRSHPARTRRARRAGEPDRRQLLLQGAPQR